MAISESNAMHIIRPVIFILAALAAFFPSFSKAASPTADLALIRAKFNDELCTWKKDWQDERFKKQVCEGDNFLDMRLLLVVQKIGTGRTHIDIPAAPVTVPSAGIINELLYVETQIDSLCRGGITDDEKLRNAVCDFRDQLGVVLNRRGYCYGMQNQIGADMRWHRCTSGSLRSAAPKPATSSLPNEALGVAKIVTAKCKAIGDFDETDGKPNRSIEVYEVGNGKRIAAFIPSRICSSKGNGVCSTDGCLFHIYSEQTPGVWSKVLDQTVLDIKIDAGRPKAAQFVFDLRGGSERCKRERSSFCTFELTWNGTAFRSRQLR